MLTATDTSWVKAMAAPKVTLPKRKIGRYKSIVDFPFKYLVAGLLSRPRARGEAEQTI